MSQLINQNFLLSNLYIFEDIGMNNNSDKSQTIFNWKVGVGCGILLLLGAFLYSKNYKKINAQDAIRIRQLKKKIDNSHDLVEDSLKPLTVLKDKKISDDKITLKFSLVANLSLKGKSVSHPKNPFMPPFEKGMLITQLSSKHRLLYNKFNVLTNHLLIVTHQFQDQKNPLTTEDFYQTSLVISALSGAFFFNCGQQSGFSQKHKHIQILPNQALKLPIIEQILNEIKMNKLVKLQKSKIFLFDKFQFIHAIIPIQNQTGEQINLDGMATKFEKAYVAMKKMLSAVLKKDEFSYNLVGCQEFIMMIPRRQQFIFKSVGINAVGFMGSILLKDEKLFEQIEYLAKPSGILRQLTFNE